MILTSSTLAVGIDPSLRATGVALHDDTLHTLTQPSRTDLYGRIDRMRSIVGALTRLVAVGSLTVVEGPAYGMGNRGTHELGWVYGGILMRLREMDCQIVIVSPTQLKKLATGRGSSVSKADMRVALLRRTGLDVPDDNQVDAWWLREAGRQLTGHPDALTLPKIHREVVDRIEVS